MPKVKTPKTAIQERAALRASEERRLKHAYDVILELMQKHQIDEREMHELYSIYTRLSGVIRNQHITDADYRRAKALKNPIVVPDEF